jgi:hypothetical protein
MIMKRKTLQWKNTKNYYEVKLAESSMFAFCSFAPQLICANTTSAPLICSSHGYHLRQ